MPRLESGKTAGGRYLRRGLLDRDGFHFFIGRKTLKHLLDAVLNEGRHAFFERDLHHLFRSSLGLDHLLHPLGPFQEFMQCDPPLVS